MELQENYRVAENFRWLSNDQKDNAGVYLTVCGIERCTADQSYGPTTRTWCSPERGRW